MSHNSQSLPIIYSAPVAAARNGGRPLVALESTIITHGMPWPQNVETARKVEAAVRDQGAEPATIAVMDGTLHIGLEEEQLDSLAKARNVMKLSRADFAYAIAQKRTGSTTVAATMIAADLAGISVFATGGIGGVHRVRKAALIFQQTLKSFRVQMLPWYAPVRKLYLILKKLWKPLKLMEFPLFHIAQISFQPFGRETLESLRRLGSINQSKLLNSLNKRGS